MSLRARLLAALLVLAALGLAVSGVATYTALRSSLLERVDQQLDAAAAPVARALEDPSSTGIQGGQITAVVPAGTWAELRDAGGRRVARLVSSYGEDHGD